MGIFKKGMELTVVPTDESEDIRTSMKNYETNTKILLSP